MILAGLQKNSFIDFPGRISCVLFVTGCNFVCPYCHNPDLARGDYPQRIPIETAIAFLKSRLNLLEGVTITGGEPTLNDGIFDLCREIKRLGYPLKLDTNGSRPGVLRRLLDQKLVDFVAMDLKAPLEAYQPFSKHPKIREKLGESIRLIMEAAPAYEFRTTCVAPFIDDAGIAAIATHIRGAACYVLQVFNQRAACLDPAFTHRREAALSSQTMKRLKALAAPFVNRCIIR